MFGRNSPTSRSSLDQQDSQQRPAAPRQSSLRAKTLTIIAFSLVTLIILLFIPLRQIVLGGFMELERQATQVSVERVVGAITTRYADLERSTADWASWDDTYQYVVDRNQSYAQANLIDPVLINNQLALFVLTNADGEVVFARAFDPQAGTQTPLPARFQGETLAGDPLFEHSSIDSKKTGLLLLPDSPPLIVSSQPILTSERQGPVHGTFIWARRFDQQAVQQLAETTRQNVAVQPIDAQNLQADFLRARSALATGTPAHIETLDNDTIAGYTVLNDVYGKPALLLRVTLPRDMYAQGRASLIYIAGALLLATLILGAVMIFLLQRTVLSRLARLNNRVQSIGAGGDLRSRLEVDGNDELAQLGAAINTMLDSLERSQQERRLQEEQARRQEAIIQRQAMTLAEVSTPLIPISDQVVAMPLVGAIDSQRARHILSALLKGLSTSRARVAIVDITGVALIDPEVAQLLIKAADATRLLGAQLVLTGIRSEVALELVRLGADLSGLITRSSLQSGISYAVEQLGAHRS